MIWTRIWKTLCSLKLAIVLASAATLLIMGGSLLMPRSPELFGALDRMPLGDWLRGPALTAPARTLWLHLAALCLVLFGLNTCCCFLDWLVNLRARWRKTGEYLLHLGAVLVLGAYLWGSFSGFRAEPLELAVGETVPLPRSPGHYLRLEDFEVQWGEGGRPLDMLSQLVLLRGETELKRATVRLNHPLLHRDLVVFTRSLAPTASGFRFLDPELGRLELRPGDRLPLPRGGELRVRAFHPHAFPGQDGQARAAGRQLGNPAYLLTLIQEGAPPRHLSWFLTRPQPAPLVEAGLQLRPLEPLTGYLSLLAASRDPGAPLAAVGGLLMGLGVCLALASYYAKRIRRDRPEID